MPRSRIEVLTAASVIYDAAFARGIEPEPRFLVSEWADRHRQLSNISSPEPGQWRTSRVPYLKEPMDCLSSMSPTRRVVMMTGAQIGKTECGNNWIGYVIHHVPGPMLMVQPTVEMARRVSQQRIAPMIEESPALKARIAPARSKDSANTNSMKAFPGGLLMITGANSAAGLRSMPIRYLFMDEVDEYPGDIDGQGDPVSLAEKRTTNFLRRKILYTSTPTIRGLSRIEKLYLEGDQSRYYIPCPHCGHKDILTWQGVDRLTKIEGQHHFIEWDGDDPLDAPKTARMVCSSCREKVGEEHKTWMLENGEWRAHATGDGETRSFHISGLYSPAGWKSWPDCVREFLNAKNDRFILRAFINNVLGEAAEDDGVQVEAEGLIARVESYSAEVPAGVGVLIASVDVQGDRLELKVKGYGANEESWLIAYSQIPGDPGLAKPWRELDAILFGKWDHASGQKVSIELTMIDSGGHHTESVYSYCAAREARRVFAVKGASTRGLPIVNRPTRHNNYRCLLTTIGTDTAKDMIYSRLTVPPPGPRSMHFPEWADLAYFKGLTSEKVVTKYVKGVGAVREYVKTQERNEPLDLEVYSLAGLYLLGPLFIRQLGERAARWMQPPSGAPAVPRVIPPRRRPFGGGGGSLLGPR